MFYKRLISLLAAACCVLGLCVGVSAAEVDCDSVYCFTAEDFSSGELTGICITALPDASAGTVLLGQRVLRPGDILTVEQVGQMTFRPLRTEEDAVAAMSYLPIYADRVEKNHTVTVSIRGKQDKAPVAEDSAVETYKNLPNEGQLKVTDPEGECMTYTVLRQPRRGEVLIREDGSFLYTPKKNKVGVDSFTYTATDPAGNVSREATVTIRIMKPGSTGQYTDTLNSDCRFAAEWMKNSGLFVGEQVGGKLCFNENKTVNRGEFLTMLIKTLNIPVDEQLNQVGYTDQVPDWLKPYLAAALRAGLTVGLPASETMVFGAEEPVTGGEAAVMLQNALDLGVTTSAMDEMEGAAPLWAMPAVTAMNENGFELEATEKLTRGQVAKILYKVSQMAKELPALEMYQ